MAEVTGTVLEMEEKLKNDTQGTYKEELLKQISETAAQVKKALDSGLLPEEFQAIEKLKIALEAASTVIKKTWDGIHS